MMTCLVRTETCFYLKMTVISYNIYFNNEKLIVHSLNVTVPSVYVAFNSDRCSAVIQQFVFSRFARSCYN